MIDDKFHRLQWIDPRGITAEVCHCIPHGGKVYYRGDSGKILKQDASRREGNFASWRTR
jgi:hypothetical protein